MRPLILCLALVMWLAVTVFLMWHFNPISAVDLSEVCSAHPGPELSALEARS